MTATIEQARDDLSGLVASFFADNAAAAAFRVGATANNATPQVLWDDVDAMRARLNDPDAGTQPWAHAMVRHATKRQVSMQNRNGVRRYRTTGLLIVELFTPGGTGLRDLDPLAGPFVRALQGQRTTNGVVVERARLVESGRSGPWFASNVSADFNYDSLE